MNKIIDIKDRYNDFLIPTSTGYTLDRIKFGKYFLSKYKIYTVEKDSYIYIDGVYKSVSDYILKSLIEQEFEKKGCSKCHWVKEALEKIKLKTIISKEKFNNIFDKNPNIINVKNGILEIINNKIVFKKHSPDILTTIQLNVNYNKDSKIDKFNYYLETSLNTEKERLFLQEHLGYNLYNGLPGQYFYCFHGTGGNGKGVYFKLMRELLGNTNVAIERSSMLSETSKQNQFYGSKFNGKLSIQVPETAYYLNNMDFIKMISGGDLHNIEVKNQNSHIQFEFKGKLTIATNDKIKIRIDEGVERRILFLKMDNKPKKVLPNLLNDLLNESEGIFNWALDGLLRLMKNNWKHTLPDTHFELFNSYWVHSDNYIRFVKSFVQNGEGVAKSELIQKFIDEFGNMHKNKLDIKEKLEEALKNEGYNVEIKKTRVNSLFGGEKNTHAYIGIEYVEHKEDSVNNQIKNIDKDIINKIKSNILILFDDDLNKFEWFIKTTFEGYNINEILLYIEQRKNNINYNRDDTLNNVIKDNIFSNKKIECFIVDDSNLKTLIPRPYKIDLESKTLKIQ